MSRRLAAFAAMVLVSAFVSGCVQSSSSSAAVAPEPDTLDAWLAWAKKQYDGKSSEQIMATFGKPAEGDVRRHGSGRLESIIYRQQKTLKDAVTGKPKTFTRLQFEFSSLRDEVYAVSLLD